MGQGKSSLKAFYDGHKELETLLNDEGKRAFVDDAKALCKDEIKGGGAVLGGYDDLQNYGNSVYSRGKEKLIRSIAKEVFASLKAQGGPKYAESAPIGDVVKKLAAYIPNPKHGKSFNKDFKQSKGKQRDVCRALGDAVNNVYGSRIVNMDGSESEICNAVSEVMHSLLTGLHTEFMTISGDMLRILNNMQVLHEVIDASYKKQTELANASGDQQIKMNAANVEALYKRIKEELDRQLAMMSNLVNVSVGPTNKSLISLLEESKDFTGLVKDIKSEVGTSAFGDKLAYLLSGISSVAHSAELIDKALKQLGMSVSEFKSAKGLQDLRLKVYDHIQKKSPSSKELDRLMAAAEIIYKNDYAHDDIAALLAKKGGCGCDGGDGDGDNKVVDDDANDSKSNVSNDGNVYDIAGGFDGGFTSVDDVKLDDTGETAYWARKSLVNKIAKKDKYRKLLFADFKKLLKGHYQQIVNAADQISKHIGRDIPLSDDLDRFVNVFSNLPALDRENLHVALSGWAKDAVSREQRDVFMNQYAVVLVAVEPLLKGPGAQHFKQVQVAIKDMMESIDNFSDKIVKSISEIHVDRPDEIRAALKHTANSFFGSADGGGGDELFGTGDFVAFDKVKNEMRYYYSIGNIKTNLGRMSDELASFGDDYEQVLGEEAGYLINRIEAEYDGMINACNPASPAANQNAIGNALAAHADGPKAYANLKNLLAYQKDAKRKLVEAAQAVDLYLRSFADGIARHPDAVGSVVKMLDQVNIVAKWFNDNSGDKLATLFEIFPSKVDNAATPDYSDVNIANGKEVKTVPDGKTNKHYYEWVEAKNAAGAQTLPGNPFIGIPIDDDTEPTKNKLQNIRSLTEKTVKSMRALENILSAFATVGSKFGDLNPQAKTFMNPGQIFNALCQYISAAAYTHNFAPNQPDLGCALYRGLLEVDTVNYNGGPHNIPTHNPTERRIVGSAGADDTSAVWSQELAEVYDGNHTSTKRIMANAGAGVRVVPTDTSTLYGLISGVRNGSDISAAVAVARGALAVAVVAGAGVAAAQAALNNALVHANAHHNRVRKRSSIAMAAIPADQDNFWDYHDAHSRMVDEKGAFTDNNVRVNLAGWMDAFYDTDLLFLMTVKSIVCKVFTVVDAYRLFNRPVINRESISKSLSPLRTILGAADGGSMYGGSMKNHPKIIPDALELYLRLPLLAEWYREKLGFKQNMGNAGPDDYKLAMVPSIDGTWSGFVRIVFDQADYVKEGNYTESQVQKIIEEINGIYNAFKGKFPKATNRNIINSFVLEVNRMFGFIKKREIDKYLESRREYLNDNTYDQKEPSNVNFDILNADNQYGKNPAPSDKFVSVKIRNEARKPRVMAQLQKEMHKLRSDVDLDFHKNLGDLKDNSFIDTLRNYKKSVENAKDDHEVYEIVLRMLQGTNKLIKTNADKLIMVHEAVAAPLAALYNVYKVMAKYNALLHGASLVNMDRWVKHRAAERAAGNNVAQMRQGVAQEFRDEYLARITGFDEYKNAKPLYKLQFVNACIGDHLHAFGTGAFGYLRNPAADIANTHAFNADFNTHFDGSLLMRDLLAAILELSCNPNKLVQCSVGDTGAINMDWSPLQELCTSLLAQVKQNANKLRIHVGANVIERYEKAENPGSVRWLEENLIEILFKDRDRCGLNVAHTEHLAQTFKALCKPRGAGPSYGPLEGFCPTLDNALRELVYYKATNENGKEPLPLSSTMCDFTTFPFNVAPLRISQLPDDEQKAVAAAKANNQTPAIGFSINKVSTIPRLAFEEPDRATLNKWRFNVANNMNSLMMSFNLVLRSYLKENLDESTLKFYTPLIEAFMNSAGAPEILQKKAFPDVITSADNKIHEDTKTRNDAANNHVLKSPPPKTVLFASHGVVMRALVNAIDDRLKKKRHAYENLAEVSEYMKERMRCNLPYFSKIFQIYYEKAELLRKLINSTDIKKNILSCVGPAVLGMVDIATGPGAENHEMKWIDLSSTEIKAADFVITSANGNNSTDARTEYFNGLIMRIADCALKLKQCADNVYKELQDLVPYFMETSRDMVNDYKARVGSLPLMPASNVLIPQLAANGVLAEFNTNATNKVLLPTSSVGSDEYKFNYASRLLLARHDIEPQLDHMPGAKDIYEKYASVVEKNNMITPMEYANTIKGMVKLARFLNDGVVYGRLMAQNNPHTTPVGVAVVDAAIGSYESNLLHVGVRDMRRYIDENIRTLNTAAGALAGYGRAEQSLQEELGLVGVALADMQDDAKHGKLLSPHIIQFSKSTKTALSDMVVMTENSNLLANKEVFANVVGSVSSSMIGNREKMRTLNILDLNIVPINVHAFMREVPFANLLNYSYTFDRMVHDFVLPTYVNDHMNDNPGKLMIKPKDEAASTRELLVKLLVHPYADISKKRNGRQVEYTALLASLFNGNDDLKLGRPRYLSDQLWHKVLLTSSAQLAAVDQNILGDGKSPESGPAAYEAIRSVVAYGVLGPQNHRMPRPTLTVAEVKAVATNDNNFKAAYEAYATNQAYTVAHLEAKLNLYNHAGNSPNALVRASALPDTIKNYSAEMFRDPNGPVVQYTTNVAGLAAASSLRTVIDAGIADQLGGGAAANRAALVLIMRAAIPVAIVGNAVDAQMRALLTAKLAAGEDFEVKYQIADGNDLTPTLQNWPNVGEYKIVVDNANAQAAVPAGHADAKLTHQSAAIVLLLRDCLNTLVVRPVLRQVLEAITGIVLSGTTVADLRTIIAGLVADAAFMNNLDPYDQFLIQLINHRAVNIGNAGYANDEKTFVPNTIIHVLPLHNAGIIIFLDRLRMPVNGVYSVDLDPVSTAGLKYFNNETKKWQVKNPAGNMEPANVLYCAEVGRARFDTKLVRNLTWLVQLQRIMRVVLINHLSWLDTPVVKGLKIADANITEYNANDAFTEQDFDGSRYDVI